ncbi:hypothetical protein DB313_01860 [Borrelia turcica IST7]|uniref:Uncharacterized protein n=1 Tax=Borrelia turcica IST7 TaxID=1104446 RepID=A0A386PML7_9SPIR|nr:hypothetical protein [Borrelia turcica]AYE36239.1 hypothetical protein DB313_01860 [Borrelia turcica IST7]
MYRNYFFKNILLMTIFILLLVGCESKNKTEESKAHDHHDHDHDHSESLRGPIDEHTLGHILHAMGISVAGKDERSKIGKAIKVMHFAGDNEGLREVDSSADAKMTVYSYENAYVAEAHIDIAGSKQDSHIFVGVSSDLKKIIDMNLNGVKNDTAREFIKTFKGLDIVDGKVNVSIDENDEDAKNILATVNFIIGSLAKTVLSMN